jgi:peptidyl-tRNA hydrolase, PTH1 family
MKVVVGLGNPGSEYVNTRHNIGFDVVERLAEKLGWVRKGDYDRMARSKFDGLTLDGMVELSGAGQEKLLLIKPTTYMNLSGRSVQQALAFYQLTPKDVMVILDDLALPCGKIRIRGSGSSGGHNGLKDIEKMLSTNAYPRLRIGIDPPPQFVPGRDYVLGKWTTEQTKLVNPAIDRACGALLTWADKGIETAMSQFNVDESASR